MTDTCPLLDMTNNYTEGCLDHIHNTVQAWSSVINTESSGSSNTITGSMVYNDAYATAKFWLHLDNSTITESTAYDGIGEKLHAWLFGAILAVYVLKTLETFHTFFRVRKEHKTTFFVASLVVKGMFFGGCMLMVLPGKNWHDEDVTSSFVPKHWVVACSVTYVLIVVCNIISFVNENKVSLWVDVLSTAGRGLSAIGIILLCFHGNLLDENNISGIVFLSFGGVFLLISFVVSILHKTTEMRFSGANGSVGIVFLIASLCMLIMLGDDRNTVLDSQMAQMYLAVSIFMLVAGIGNLAAMGIVFSHNWDGASETASGKRSTASKRTPKTQEPVTINAKLTIFMNLCNIFTRGVLYQAVVIAGLHLFSGVKLPSILGFSCLVVSVTLGSFMSKMPDTDKIVAFTSNTLATFGSVLLLLDPQYPVVTSMWFYHKNYIAHRPMLLWVLIGSQALFALCTIIVIVQLHMSELTDTVKPEQFSANTRAAARLYNKLASEHTK